MNRGDILAKLQSTSAAETRTLSITDAAIQNKTDANTLNAFDAQSVFKLISSASDLEQRFESDKECESTKNEATLQALDMQSTTKNKRKNFKPRNSTAVDATEPSLTDQLILNLMMQNKMKQLQQELHQGQFKRWTDDGKVDQQTGGDSDRSTTSNNNESCNNSLKSPPSSPLGNGHGGSGGKGNHYIDGYLRSLVINHLLIGLSIGQKENLLRKYFTQKQIDVLQNQ